MKTNLFNIKANKENNSPNVEFQNLEKEDNSEFEYQINNQFRNSYMPKIHSGLRKNLEKIYENDEEDNYNSIKNEFKDDFEISQKPQEIIKNLKTKIIDLENQIINLRKKNDILMKDNIENDSKMKRMSFIGTRRKFIFGSPGEKSKIEIAELIKEKNDLQEINEKMLNMLTEKELENEELQDNFDKYKTNIKNEIQNYLDIINDLKEKNEIYENNIENKENFDKNLDEIINEYNIYKERMEKSLNEYIKKEEELNLELENKENCIQNMKNDIQNLELEIIQLQSLKEQKEKDQDEELINIDIIISENEKLKNEIISLEAKIRINEENYKNSLLSQENEIKILNQDVEFYKKNQIKIKEEKNKEINILKNEINKCNKDISNLIKKNEEIQRKDEEINENINILQNKLDKKTKELQDIKESANKLIENKENQIKQYEDKIEEINKDKNILIEQNHELLDKIKNMNSTNLSDLLNEEEEEDQEKEKEKDNINNKNENILLIAEIKTLKEQLENQAHDLVSLNAMEKEVNRLKIENSKLIEDYKNLNEKMKKQKYDIDADNLMNSIKKQFNALRMSTKNDVSMGSVKDLSLSNKKIYEKQIETLKKMKENENKTFLNEIDKLKGELAILKVKYLNQNLENETTIVKYKNIIKTIYQECNKRGIKFNIFNFNNL